MYESKHPIDELVHLYVDGAFDRRELVQRVVRVTGSLAAALVALGGFEELRAQAPSVCPAGVSIPADAPDLEGRDVEFAGPGGRMLGYLVQPREMTGAAAGDHRDPRESGFGGAHSRRHSARGPGGLCRAGSRFAFTPRRHGPIHRAHAADRSLWPYECL